MSKGELFDYVVLGGGIVGVSTALSVKTKHPEKRVLLLEKEGLLHNIKLAIIVV
jgi:L-2-hydroxyglutarate oxidase